ncbi:MAG TPA: DUF4236 domain-containing protein [Pyrinomonadaceae bacterium]|nr:DUF4236 domain-containing protein [Pyrinomonadaceae bacterium]
MGWRFRKSVKLLPGIRLNFGKRGFTSATFGKDFFKTNVSKKGVKQSISVPGTGISYQTKTQRFEQNSNQNQVLYKPTETCWTCSKCSMINLPDSGYCEMCGRENPRLIQARAEQTGLLHWYCKTCYSQNYPENRTCRNCGDVYNPNLQRIARKPIDNTAPILLVIGGVLGVGFLGLIFLSALISAFAPKSNYSQNNPTSPYSLAPTTTPTIPAPTPRALLNVSEPVKKVSFKSAAVITENANLRNAPDETAGILQTIPVGSSINVIKQKGAWFFVGYGNSKGWMHGNTIRYVNNEEISAPVPTTNYLKTLPSPDLSTTNYPDTTNSYSVPSNPKTYDYGPKTVYVRGYTRRNGTYVAPYMRRAPRR